MIHSHINWVKQRDIAITLTLWIALIGTTFWVIGQIISILIILVIAMLIAFILHPLVDRLTRFMPRWLAIVLSYILTIIIISGFIYYILNTAIMQGFLLTNQLTVFLHDNPHTSISSLILKQGFISNLGISQSQLSSIGQHLVSQLNTQLQGFTTNSISIITSIFDSAFNLIFIFILSIYFLANADNIQKWIHRYLPTKQQKTVDYILHTIIHVMGGYIKGQFILAVLVGTFVGIGMQIFHVPYAILLGALAFFLEFVPVIGVFISGLICILVALSQGVFITIFVLLYFIGVHIFEGDVVGPRIVGAAVGIHPAISLIAVIVGAKLFGILGVLFAAPFAAMAQSFIAALWSEHVQS